SSFPTGLQPVASKDVNATITRRISRTDLDFEQALRAGGTVVLKEGFDVDTLGADISNSSISLSPFSSPSPSERPYFGVQPATPTVVPPTPSPSAPGRGVGLSTPSKPRSSITSSSSNEVYYDAEDSDFQTKRRSMYRSPGTASSPDLATLLRKARERGKQDARKGAAAAPDGSPSKIDVSKGSSRQRSSTSSSLAPPLPNMQGSPALKDRPSISTNLANSSSASSEWVLTSPRSLTSIREGGAKAKSSVRAKTSAFLGKMLGTSSTRDRQRSLTSSPSSTSIAAYAGHQLMDAFAPPVPPLPKDVQREVQESKPRPSVQTDVSDVFSSASGTSDKSKPLPAIRNSVLYSDADCSDEQSLVMVEPPRDGSPSPTTTVKGKSPRNSRVTARNKRRSMSVSDADIKRVLAAGSSSGPLRISNDGKPPDVWDPSLNGILSEFKGQLSQLDPISASSLDLRDPSTPSRRLQLNTRANTSLPLHLNTPTVTLHPAGGEDDSILNAVLSPRDSSSSDGPIVPPRVSSLHTPLRSRSGSSAASQTRVPSLKYGPRTPSFRNGASPVSHSHSASRDANRLRVQPRSTASSSEPSLIPEPVDGRVLPGLSAVSQQDLTTHDLLVTRFNANRSSPGRGEETADLEARGKELASRCWAEDEEFLAKDKIAEWLGGMLVFSSMSGRNRCKPLCRSLINKTALRHYMDFFDFSNLRLDNAFRRLCAKLFLKAETQQVDRILEEFSRRYWECNSNSVYGNASVVHATSYSLLLLNTDLHVAELVSRMSRGQFVRNTLAAIQMQLQPNPSPNTEYSYDDWSSFRAGSEGSDLAGSTLRSRPKRSDSMTSWSSVTREALSSQPAISAKAGNSTGQLSSASDPPGPSPANGSTVSVAISAGHAQDTKTQDTKDTKPRETAPISTTVTYDRNWETEMENLLKDMYNAIKSQQILQPIGSTLMARSSTSSLSPHGPLLRNRSLRGGPPDRLTTLKRGSIRGLQSILGAPSGISPYSSNSSIDGRASPAPSFATSNEGFHASTASFLTPSMGFASNLSHTIIRETQEDDHSVHSDDSVSDDLSITDEELALLGPPWAKEGMLCRKQYWEAAGKRAKSKQWLDVFVVIQKGDLSMFTFGEHGAGGGGVVGGGNWLENAHSVGTVQLAHSLAHALPPPGYNRQRPHCMVLTLAHGGVYFFQAGTEELVNEWVSTCNYWAARQSKEPLAGGVSNMEYGWNRVMKPLSRGRAASEDNYTAELDNSDGLSIRSGRSGRSRLKDIAATVRAEKSPWADRTFINDWKPPMHPTVPSTHDEETQLEALQKHVENLKNDLKQHNELRSPMTQLYQPRSSNGAKALSNWEKKSQYLLTEIVKYESYIDSLQAAMTLRLKKRGEKAMEKALVVQSPVAEQFPVEKGRWKGQPEEETIEEDDEPPPSASNSQNISALLMHRRELAQMGDDTDDE
ncbi:CsMn39, partial [Gelatoporia subvermispora B]